MSKNLGIEKKKVTDFSFVYGRVGMQVPKEAKRILAPWSWNTGDCALTHLGAESPGSLSPTPWRLREKGVLSET